MGRVCWVALGSNLDNPTQQIKQALALLKASNAWQVTGVSQLHETKPMGPADQPNYVNAVVRLQTGKSAAELLRDLLSIEVARGRVRNGTRWGPRVLDLDLLLCGNGVINTDELCLPHPGLLEREFVLQPMSDIDAEFVLPNGKTVQQQLRHLKQGEKI